MSPLIIGVAIFAVSMGATQLRQGVAAALNQAWSSGGVAVEDRIPASSAGGVTDSSILFRVWDPGLMPSALRKVRFFN